MKTVEFSNAKPIFVPFVSSPEATVNQYGFYRALDLTEYGIQPEREKIFIRLTARNVYRLYVNGEIVMHGPARTAHGYCRVDEIDIAEHLIAGINHIAVEVIEYGYVREKYSNDSSLEKGMLIAEIIAGDRVIDATGIDGWLVCCIKARASQSERISHCRECTEIYTTDENFHSWKTGVGEYSYAVPVEEEPVYLAHNSLMPTLQKKPFLELTDFGVCKTDENIIVPYRRYDINANYFPFLKEHPLVDCQRTVVAGSGSIKVDRHKGDLTMIPSGCEEYYAFFDSGENNVGFVSLKITCAQEGIVDIVPTELLDTDGSIMYGYNFVTRLHVSAGKTEFVAMEPMISRYIKLIFRGTGKVTVHEIAILDYAYPDEHRASFLCSNENVNRLYKAAKKTLLLNTLDIFMDCPGRERGGWLCDSLWTARAAALMLSDSRVEREFLENFLLTDAGAMRFGFFPDVYPSSKPSFSQNSGITTWSFWMMCEVCEFIRRAGDLDFRDEYKPRIEQFVKGSLQFIGGSGLLENLPKIFIDWSLSNKAEYHQPVSTPANALYSYMLIELGKTFGEDEWVALGQKMRAILRETIIGKGTAADIKHIPDSFKIDDNGVLRPKDYYSEAAMYTTLWTELFSVAEAPLLLKSVRDQMGPVPIFAKTPYVGNSGLFIGLCIRLDMLCRHGFFDKMFEDMMAIYEPQLKEGPGTLWENEVIEGNSRCHGFNAHAGVHLMRDVLGLGIPVAEQAGEEKYSMVIAPHICGLRWAKGTYETPEGIISVCWKYDGESFELQLSVPSNVKYRLVLPREVRMLDEDKISLIVNEY